MHTIPADKVHTHIVSTLAEFQARRDASKAFIMEGADEDTDVIILSSVRETVGMKSGPSMRAALGLAA